MAEEELRFRAVGTDDGAGRMMDKLKRGADGAGDAINDLNKDLKSYDQQISETEQHLKGLVAEFAKTGDQALFKDVRRDRSRLNMLSYLRRQLTEEGGSGSEVGKREGKALAGSFNETARSGITAALKSLPELTINANSSPAEAHLAKLKAELVALSNKEIGVDINADSALAELARLKAELAVMSKDTGVSAQLRFDTTAAVGSLAKTVERLAPEAANLGTELGSKIGLSAGPTMMGVIGGAAALAAPFIGSIIGAAVIGGVGLGGIAGGIAAAAQDPRVQTAGMRLADSLKSSLGQVGEPFVAPLLEQMPRLEVAGASAFAAWGAQLAPLADHLDNLVDGATGFVDNLDFSKAVEAAGPLIDIIGEELPNVADSLVDMLDSISEEGDGLAVGLKNLFDLIEGGIEATGDVIGFLASVEDGIVDLGAAVNELSEEFLDSPLKYLFPYLIPLAAGLDSATDKADEYTAATIRAKGPTEDFGDGLHDAAAGALDLRKELNNLNDAFNTYFGQIMDLREATLAYKRGIKETYDALKEGKPTLSENTELGQDHLDALNAQVKKIEDVRDAEFARTGDLDTANAHYREHIKTLKDTVLELGYGKKAADKYFEALENIPEVVKTQLIIESIDGGFKRKERDAGARAMGGPVIAGRTYMVGENGPEPVTFGENGRVLSPAQSAGLMSGTSGGAAAPTSISVALVARQSESTTMTALVQALIPYLQVEVIGQGGVAQDVLGRIGG